MTPTEGAISFDVIVASVESLQRSVCFKRIQRHGWPFSSATTAWEVRIYPSFWTQWTHGIEGFSDMPVERPPCVRDLVRVEYTAKYLEDYVKNTGHAGQALRDRIQFNTHVGSVEKEHFNGKIIHSVDYGQSDVIQDKYIQHVAVNSAGKSAADMVYETVKAGNTVSWIIHETGNGSLGGSGLRTYRLAYAV
ncbi:hypothetical protein GGS26DRAFT_596021 [Hypomontagnella submonticulosa]|nr:hypothetical protein GGS26DRAFT_596021 [Hypomontagnella submonticulosa]